MNAKSKGEELIERIKVEETPFTIVRYEDKWFLTMGKYRLTEPMETREQAEADAQNSSWARILQVIQIMIDENEQQKQDARRIGEAVGEG